MNFIDKAIVDSSNLVADLATAAIELDTILHFSVQIVWASTTAAASVAVQVSNDGLNWINLATPQAIANDSGNVMVEKANNPYKFMRVSIDWTSGSVTSLKCIYSAKGF